MSEPQSEWIHKGASILFVIFCAELGLFLLIYPWTSRWTMNVIPTWLPVPPEVWLNGYLRGAVSGLGIANVWVAFVEALRIRRARSRKPESQAART
jgi:uncharacterized protein (DUF2062 family)